MKLCKIVGKCWSTVKDEQLTGSKFLLAREILNSGELKAEFIIAIDELGAAEGDTVIITEGEAVFNFISGNKPIDSVIIAIVEGYSVKDK